MNFMPDDIRYLDKSTGDLAVICSPSYVWCEINIFLSRFGRKIPFPVIHITFPFGQILQKVIC